VSKELFQVSGRMSTFGGPNDSGVSPDEGLALIDDTNLDQFGDLFLKDQPEGTTGLARRLNPAAFYLACRWDYEQTPKKLLLQLKVEIRNMTPESAGYRKSCYAQPVDWGPSESTGRVADLSPGLAAELDLKTDDLVEVLLLSDS
jgi:hypothetical protein